MHKSKKVILLFVLTMVILFHSVGFAEIVATPTSAKVVVNGKLTNFEAYSIGGSNYFKLKDIAFIVNGSDKQFAVNWDGTKKVINLVSGAPYSPVGSEMSIGDGKSKNAVVNTSKIYKDGHPVELTAYTIGGYNFFKLKDLAQAFNIGLTWDPTTKTVGIDTAKNYDENTKSEVLLTSIIETEAYTYWGEVKDGNPHGQGKMIWKDGDIYEGEFVNGEYEGQGTYIWYDGDKYVGEFVNGNYNGQGTYFYSDGDKYVGGFLNGYFSGQGTFFYIDGSTYVGKWLDDEKNGQGIYTWSDGDRFVGEFHNDLRNGQGTYTSSNGEMYVGEYLNDECSGQGTYTWPDGTSYVGEFQNDLYNGQGIYTWSDGSTYVGEFQNDLFHGHGAEYDASGKLIREGYYQYDVFIQ